LNSKPDDATLYHAISGFPFQLCRTSENVIKFERVLTFEQLKTYLNVVLPYGLPCNFQHAL